MDDLEPLEAGQTGRYNCGDCLTEYEVTLEPKAKSASAHGIDPKAPKYCPFCGSDIVEE